MQFQYTLALMQYYSAPCETREVTGKSIPGQKGPRAIKITGNVSQQRNNALNVPCWEALAQGSNRCPKKSESPPLSKISGLFSITSVLLQHYSGIILALFQH